jgi:glycosyltransferase involved in cell wall biosynthesis
LTRLPPALLTNRWLHWWRRRTWRAALRRPDGFVMGSRCIEQSHREQGLLRAGDRVWVRPYGVPLAELEALPRSRPGSRRPLRFGYVGAILPHKGVHLAVAAFRGLDPDHATLQVCGDFSISGEYREHLETLRDPATVTFEAPFPEDEKARHLADLDCLILPSIGLESFGLVAREAMAVGTPVIVARGSALDELLGELGEREELDESCAFDADSVPALRTLVEELGREPERLGRWHDRLPRPKSADRHAEEIEEIYEALMQARGGTVRSGVRPGVRTGP